MKFMRNATVIVATILSGCGALPGRYVTTEATGVLKPGESFSIYASCAPGDEVYAGGWRSSAAPAGSAAVSLTADQPGDGPPDHPTSWHVAGTNAASNTTRVIVYAHCWDLAQ